MVIRQQHLPATGSQPERLIEERTTVHSFSPGGVIEGVLGLLLVFVGAVTMAKTGVSRDVTQPMTTVFSVPQSAGVALVEVVAGLLLIIGAFDYASSAVAGVIGVLAIGFGLPAVSASTQLQHDFGFASSTGWFFVGWGAIALAAALLPVFWKQKREIDVIA